MRSIIDGLRRIGQEDLGAIDNTIGYICKYDGNATIDDILSGNVSHWYWRTIPSAEAENMNSVCIMLVKHVDENPTLAKILKQMKIHITSLGFIPLPLNAPEMKEIPVGISGIVVNEILFLRDRFKTNEYIIDFSTQEDLQMRRGVALNSYCLRGRFDLTLCSYYCEFK